MEKQTERVQSFDFAVKATSYIDLYISCTYCSSFLVNGRFLYYLLKTEILFNC